MNRDQHLQKKNWRLPFKRHAEAAATAAVLDGRAATSLPVAAGSGWFFIFGARAYPGKYQATPVKTLPVSNQASRGKSRPRIRLSLSLSSAA